MWLIVKHSLSPASIFHINNTYPSQVPELASELFQVTELTSLKINDPLSDYATHPKDAGKSLKQLLVTAEMNIPQDAWDNTPIYLHATAGLRNVLPEEAAAILEACGKTLLKSNFKFHPGYAQIISGYV